MNKLNSNEMFKIYSVMNELGNIREKISLSETTAIFEKMYNQDNSILEQSTENILDMIIDRLEGN